MRQHTGADNGHLQLFNSWLRKPGWTSADVIRPAKRKPLDRDVIIKARRGGLNMVPDNDALTWFDINDFSGSDITNRSYHRGAWAGMN